MTARPLAEASVIAERITTWFASHARILPWRSAPTPYAVLLSELMAQQTRIDTVVPYFDRFVARWPTIEALAAADEQEVLGEWAGLGYYSRARNLLACARAVVARGGMPSEPSELVRLPGVGPYTAGAVASIAFGVRAPLVDGNVERVLSRIDARAEDPRKEGRAALWARAGALVDALPEGGSPGALNQGLMELGATVCSPRAPKCGACPVEDLCRARPGDPESLPVRPARSPPRATSGVAVVIRSGDRVLLGRRPKGLLGGLWEPPWVEGASLEALEGRCGRALERWVSHGEVVHVFTHRRLTLAVYGAEPGGSLAADGFYTELRWAPTDGAPPAELGGVALSALARRVLAARPLAQVGLPLAAER